MNVVDSLTVCLALVGTVFNMLTIRRLMQRMKNLDARLVSLREMHFQEARFRSEQHLDAVTLTGQLARSHFELVNQLNTNNPFVNRKTSEKPS